MHISRKTLDAAVAQQIIDAHQAQALFEFFQQNATHQPRFVFTHVLYYLGGLVAIGAMTLFMSLGWERFGGGGLVFICLCYAVIGMGLSERFAQRALAIPAGICATFVVCLTPLAIYGLQHWLGVWPDDTPYRDYHRFIEWHWLYMELGTLVVGAVIAWKYKYPFLLMPIAVTLWYLTMDITAMLTGGDYDWELRKQVSMYAGLLMLGLAFWIDIRARHSADYAFWIYLFGTLAFWGGLSWQHSDSELAKFFYCCTNLLMIGIGVLLVRRVFVIFGALGCSIYLGHLAFDVFKDSMLFPVALSAIGLGVIYLGIIWQKHEQALTRNARKMLPHPLRELLDARR